MTKCGKLYTKTKYTEGRFETDKAVLIFDTLRLAAGSFILFINERAVK